VCVCVCVLEWVDDCAKCVCFELDLVAQQQGVLCACVYSALHVCVCARMFVPGLTWWHSSKAYGMRECCVWPGRPEV